VLKHHDIKRGTALCASSFSFYTRQIGVRLTSDMEDLINRDFVLTSIKFV